MIDHRTIRDLGMGAAVLSTGGGSFPYLEVLAAQEVLAAHGPVRLVQADSLADDANVAYWRERTRCSSEECSASAEYAFAARGGSLDGVNTNGACDDE